MAQSASELQNRELRDTIKVLNGTIEDLRKLLKESAEREEALKEQIGDSGQTGHPFRASGTLIPLESGRPDVKICLPSDVKTPYRSGKTRSDAAPGEKGVPTAAGGRKESPSPESGLSGVFNYLGNKISPACCGRSFPTGSCV